MDFGVREVFSVGENTAQKHVGAGRRLVVGRRRHQQRNCLVRPLGSYQYVGKRAREYRMTGEMPGRLAITLACRFDATEMTMQQPQRRPSQRILSRASLLGSEAILKSTHRCQVKR